MNYLRHKFSSSLNFVRAERVYFLILVLTLGLFALDSSQTPPTDFSSSAAVDQLEQASKNFGESLQSLSTWIQIAQTRPWSVIACVGIMTLFIGLFVGGALYLLLLGIIPPLHAWFYRSVSRPLERDWQPALLFRAFILIFAGIVASSALMEFFWPVNSQNENFMGLFHTLLIDLFACSVVFALFKKEGLSWSDLIGKPAESHADEVQRGLSVYLTVFPLFVLSLLFVLVLAEWLHYEPPAHPLVKIFVEEESRSAFVFRFALILATIGAPLFEEIFFRGFCYRLFRSWWGVSGATIASASFFAGIHGSGFSFFPIFVLGLALAWLYEKRGCLTACWTFHILHNCLFTGYFFSVKALLGASPF